MTTINPYDYIYLQDDPDFDYQVKVIPKPVPKALPKHVTMAIENDGESKRLYIHSWQYSKEISQIGSDYSLEFTDDEIIEDLSEEIEQLFMVD